VKLRGRFTRLHHLQSLDAITASLFAKT